MGTSKISKIAFINTCKDKNIKIFNIFDLEKLFEINSKNTLKQLVRRLAKERIIERLIRGKYLFLYTSSLPSDFFLANYLVIPSYISLESALSYYGLIEQFTYRITSVILEKPRRFKVRNKDFVFSKILPDYFKDFVKIDDFLIASKEKALFDYFYFIYKGLRPKNMIEEITLLIRKKGLKEYFLKNALGSFKNFIKNDVRL